VAKEFQEKLEKELKGITKNFVVQIESASEDYTEVVESSLRYLLKDKKARGVYVTLNKPALTLINQLENKNIDTKRLFFIDGISGEPEKTGNEHFVVLSGPTALTELGIEMAKAKETGKYDFIFFDALSTLLIYNSVDRCLQFSYFLLAKLRSYNLSGIVIYIKSDLEKKIFDSVIHLTDKAVRF